MKLDKIFENKKVIHDFTFDSEVVEVFDDMINRSVPMYKEFQNLIVDICEKFCIPNTNIYDLGCSLGNTSIAIANKLKSNGVVGIDSSLEMIQRAKKDLSNEGLQNVSFLQLKVDENIKLDNPGIVVFSLVLQFIRPNFREKIIKRIYEQLPENGVVILFEKVIFEEPIMNRSIIDLYYNFKSTNGYSESEITKKRSALENILVPFSQKENIDLLLSQGFKECSTVFQYLNFCGIVAIK